MNECMVMKGADGTLVAYDEGAREFIEALNMGIALRAKFTKLRNPKFHRKFFGMLDVGFDAFDPGEKEYRGLPCQKNRERFRKDVIVAAGFFDPVIALNGEIRAEAKSISFANMDDIEFEQVYSKVADVLLQRVLKNYTREDLDNVVQQIMGFV